MNIWKIDQAHSEIGFKIKHLMISNVRGHFKDFDGEIKMIDEDLTKAEINFTIQTTSVNTNNESRDEHLKSADFFDVTQLPTISFKSNKITKISDTDFTVTGELSMHGATKEVTLNTIFNGVTVGMDEVEVMSFEIAGSLNRGDFGLVWNTPIKTGGLTLSDEVKIEINAEFKKS